MPAYLFFSHLAGLHLDRSLGSEAFEELSVVSHEEHGASEGQKGRLELLDGEQVQMIGGLVEDEAVDASCLEEREGGPGPLAWREAGRSAADVVCAEAELRQEGACLDREQPRSLGEALEEAGLAQEAGAALLERAEDHPGADEATPDIRLDQPLEQPEESGLPRAVRADDGHPISPPDLEIHGTEPEGPAFENDPVEPGDDVTAPARLGDVEAELPAFPGLRDGVQALQSPLGRPGLGGDLLTRGDAVRLDVLVLFFGIGLRLAGPLV